MKVSLAQLQALYPRTTAHFADWLDPLNDAMGEFRITTEARIEMFLAQVFHETRGLTVLAENLNYSAQGLANTWDRYSASGKRGGAPNALAKTLERRPQAIGNNVYANRLGNGSEASGEGFIYRGHGPLMTTGKSNYLAVERATGIPCVANPDVLMQPVEGSRAAGYFWQANGLNEVADKGSFTGTTRVINGGDIGGAERLGLWDLAKRVIK